MNRCHAETVKTLIKPMENTFSRNADIQTQWNHTWRIRTNLFSFSIPILKSPVPLFLNSQNTPADTPKGHVVKEITY